MTREEVYEKVKQSNTNCKIISLPTSFGKTRLALIDTYTKGPLLPKVLVVYPKVNLKTEWLDEYAKWGFERHLADTTFTTYNSLHKHAGTHWDMVIFDEGHHITNRVMDIIKVMTVDRVLILSATVPYTFVYKMRTLFPNLEVFHTKTQEAIEDSVLPEPTIYLWPLLLNYVDKTQTIVKNPRATKNVRTIEYKNRHNCLDKNTKYTIPCTEMQYYADLSNMVDWYKRKAMGGNQVMHNLWMQKAGERLKWLATVKTRYVEKLLQYLNKERTLTFCCSIEQTEALGKNCIHSKNKKATNVKDKFNEKLIDHITSCNMLDEGANLVECRIGIFASINASSRMQTQRVGRILRHQKPIIIIPYYKDTREEEIVFEMIKGYNHVVTIKSLEEIEL